MADADSDKECPACLANEGKRQVCAPQGFKFEGSGFYETDFKRK